jgi:hypothetical protein
MARPVTGWLTNPKLAPAKVKIRVAAVWGRAVKCAETGGGESMLRKTVMRWVVAAMIAFCGWAIARAQMPNPLGGPVTLENARKAAGPALAEAEKNHWNVLVAIVDTGGNLVYYEKMDNTQIGSANVAIEKARTAALFKRPTKAFQEVGEMGCGF